MIHRVRFEFNVTLNNRWTTLYNGLQAGAPEGASQYWFENFSHKKLKSILKYISFLTLINALWWKDKRISDVTFYTEIYFTRMQRFFISDVFCLRKKNWFCFNDFLSMFFQRRLMLIIQHIWFHNFLFFILRWNKNSHKQKKTLLQLFWFTLEQY